MNTSCILICGFRTVINIFPIEWQESKMSKLILIWDVNFGLLARSADDARSYLTASNINTFPNRLFRQLTTVSALLSRVSVNTGIYQIRLGLNISFYREHTTSRYFSQDSYKARKWPWQSVEYRQVVKLCRHAQEESRKPMDAPRVEYVQEWKIPRLVAN